MALRAVALTRSDLVSHLTARGRWETTAGRRTAQAPAAAATARAVRSGGCAGLGSGLSSRLSDERGSTRVAKFVRRLRYSAALRAGAHPSYAFHAPRLVARVADPTPVVRKRGQNGGRFRPSAPDPAELCRMPPAS